MKAREVLEHFLSRADWVDPKETVDRIVAGDPDAEIDRCLVTWMPSRKALQGMIDRGITLMICHEPTYWAHVNDRPSDDPAGRRKEQFIREHGLVILRNHDCWDRWPGEGIPWAWAKFLGLGPKPARIGARGYQHRYDIPAVPLDELARRIAEKCRPLGEPLVQVTGDGARNVSRIGIGTGCGCDIYAYLEMDCDCSVVCDDGSCYWSGIQQAEDLGHPIIRVNHGTSEEPGMVSLTRYVNENIEGLTAEHLPHGSTFRLVGA